MVPPRWLAMIYGAALVPVVGPLALVVGSSIAYYRLIRLAPDLARSVNRHAWFAIVLSTTSNAAVLFLTH